MSSGEEGQRLRMTVIQGDPQAQASMLPGLVESGFAATRLPDVASLVGQPERPDVVVIDLKLALPVLLDAVAQAAKATSSGLLVLAPGGTDADVAALFDAGADDVIVEPAEAPEIAERSRAVARVVRRAAAGKPLGVRPPERDLSKSRYQRPPVWLAETMPVVTLHSADRHLVGADGRTSALTKAELAALTTLLDAKGEIVSRERLGAVALGTAVAGHNRGVDMLILKLRDKLVDQGMSRKAIMSAQARGYFIVRFDRFVTE